MAIYKIAKIEKDCTYIMDLNLYTNIYLAIRYAQTNRLNPST